MSDSVEQRSEISNGTSMLSNVSQIEQKDVNAEFSNAEFPNVLDRQDAKFSNAEFLNVLVRQNVEFSHAEPSNVVDTSDRQDQKNNAEFPIELNRPFEEGVLNPKERSRYLYEEEWPLPGSHGTSRHGRLTTGEPATPMGTCKAGNDQRAGDYIVPLSVTTHQHESGKNMNTCTVV